MTTGADSGSAGCRDGWYVKQRGNVYGPSTADEIESLLKDNRANVLGFRVAVTLGEEGWGKT